MNNLPIQTYESVVQQRDALEKKLLAYEQAAKNEVALPEALKYAEIYGRAFICVDRSGSVHAVDPSQITLTILNEPAPVQPAIPRELRSFVTDADFAALHRFAECCDDPESGGHDLEKEQVQRLEKIGALQRSGRISYITDFGDYLISLTVDERYGKED